MDCGQGRGGQELDCEVPIADGVDRVRGRAGEPQLIGNHLAVEGEAGPGDRPRTERTDVRPSAAVGQTLPIAFQHLDVGQQVMGQQDGLGRLEVGRAGQDRSLVALGELDERQLEGENPRVEAIDGATQPQAQVGGYLVVA